MKFQFTDTHLVLQLSDGKKVRMTLDEADRLRGLIERNLYRKDREFKKAKEVVK